MRLWICLAMSCLFAANTCSADRPLNTLSEAERRSGWELLFDGKSAESWRNYKQDKLSAGWAIENGALSRKGKDAGDIISKKQYENFELQLEYRISKGGNSGLMFHVQEGQHSAAFTGPEIQIQDNVHGHDSIKSGWLYQLYKPVKPAWAIKFENQVGYKSPDVSDATRPFGEWNQIYLRVTKTNGEVCMNGVSYYYFVKGNADWNKRVAASKFKNFPEFGKATKGHIALQDHGNPVAFRNIKIRVIPESGKTKQPIDGTLDLKTEVAFPQMEEWEGYQPVDDKGRPQRIRPLQLMHAGDGSNRIFVANQAGMIHVFKNDRGVKKAKLFLDIRKRVHQWRVDDEEGVLGFAIHPKFKKTGQVFVYYNTKDKPRLIYLSRFTRSKNDPNKADPDSEEILLKIQQPFANHNGGPMAFGPDGYLYIGMGDGGGRNDPENLGQAKNTFMGNILRIDVDRKDAGKKYAVPPDNPFVGQKDALPEVNATGIRNTWRLSFDRKLGSLWIGDVGQDLWEEIHIIEKGGNYGWSIREASKNFGNAPGAANVKVSDPVWEYDHQIGKSITGGYVYRGKQIPELEGHYLYADFITGKLWALHYDQVKRRVLRNMAIPWNGLPIVAFGEDEDGEIYVMTPTVSGNGIYKLLPSK